MSPLWAAMEAAGGVSADYHGRRLMRHFGDPSGAYEAATSGAVVFDRSHRARLAVTGRAPGQMLSGILTGSMPKEPTELGGEVLGGEATYHAVLTVKGRMLSDLWLMLRGDDQASDRLQNAVAQLSCPAFAPRILPPNASPRGWNGPG